MALDFRDILTAHGLDLSTVMMMRHSPLEPRLRKNLPWLAAEKPETFNAYQRVQNPKAEKALMKADFVASFIAQDEGKQALFVGIYRRGKWRPVNRRQFWARPEVVAMKPFGLRGLKHSTHMWFDLKPESYSSHLKGCLVVKWPEGRLWWRWAKSRRKGKEATFPIEAIFEESQLSVDVTTWNRLSLKYDELKLLSSRLKDKLREWRGVYYIFDTRIRRGYVGSACGDENILGRWLNYAASGHGGNKRLKKRNPKDFLFTIIERTSPDIERKDIVALEQSWKERLHTRDYGLNDN